MMICYKHSRKRIQVSWALKRWRTSRAGFGGKRRGHISPWVVSLGGGGRGGKLDTTSWPEPKEIRRGGECLPRIRVEVLTPRDFRMRLCSEMGPLKGKVR